MGSIKEKNLESEIETLVHMFQQVVQFQCPIKEKNLESEIETEIVAKRNFEKVTIDTGAIKEKNLESEIETSMRV